MEIIIKGDAKEIAALVVAIQERREEKNETAGNGRMGAILSSIQKIPFDSDLGKRIKACLDDSDCLVEA